MLFSNELVVNNIFAVEKTHPAPPSSSNNLHKTSASG
jgi:hypothetical protein